MIAVLSTRHLRTGVGHERRRQAHRADRNNSVTGPVGLCDWSYAMTQTCVSWEWLDHWASVFSATVHKTGNHFTVSFQHITEVWAWDASQQLFCFVPQIGV